MNKQAVESAITALTSTVMDDQKTSWASNMPAWAGLDGLTHHMDFEELCGSIDLAHVATEVIEAARPHIEAELRQKIAAEIRTSRLRPANNWGSHDSAVLEGLDLATRIVEGKA